MDKLSSDGAEEKIEMLLITAVGCHKFPFAEKYEILAYAMNRQLESHDAIEERVQSANKAFWKNILIFKSKDVPWKVKCQRLVGHVHAVFGTGGENRSWTIQIFERIKGWETKTMLRLFHSKDTMKKHGPTTILKSAI